MNVYIEKFQEKISNLTITNSLKLVIGNESCDLDSAISAIVYAFFLDYTSKKIDANVNDIVLPLLNIPKEDLPLKTEVIYLLKKYDIQNAGILCRDGVGLESLHERCNLKVILVDHHILSESLSRLTPNVEFILDHRPKDTMNWKYADSVQFTITTVGSCATLVGCEILHSPQGVEFLKLNKVAGYLLYETIVLDTVNFLPSADRARPLDFEVAKQLEEVLEIKNCDEFKKQHFNNLLAARTDYSSLTTLQLLRRDLKIVKGFPIPGLPLLVKKFLQRDDVIIALQTFCRQHNTSTVLIIGLEVEDNTVTRDIAVFSTHTCDLHTTVTNALTDAANPSLNLESVPCGVGDCDYFQQHNIKASRKQIIPIVNNILN